MLKNIGLRIFHVPSEIFNGEKNFQLRWIFWGSKYAAELERKTFFGWRIFLEIYTFTKCLISEGDVRPISVFIHVRNNTNICLVRCFKLKMNAFQRCKFVENLFNLDLSVIFHTYTLKFQIHYIGKKRKVTKKTEFVAPWRNVFARRTPIPRVVCWNSVRCWSHI